MSSSVTTRRKLDNRIRELIERCVSDGHRSMFVVVGDKARDQVAIVHHLLSKASVRARPNVLWCFKKELDFSSHKRKKMKKLNKKIKSGTLDVDGEDPFELFVASTRIRYCYYRESHKILGNTFGMCVLQDFEALTPNLLAKTIETVEGGGSVVVLMRSVHSLRQLFTMAMDVHARYRTEAHQDVVGRFNERFILSLASNRRCLVLDDALNVLPLSSHVRNVTSAPASNLSSLEESENELKSLKSKFADSQPTGSLLNLCKTLDQAQALLEFIDAITEKKLDRTISLTAARGRGKSAALGLAMAAAVGFGYSNIFVTSPSPENLGTLFDFVFKGFDAMNYEEHIDYDLVQSTNSEFSDAVVRVNIHERNQHRQTIQYLHPSDANKLGQAELLVIDEAAAIPLPIVKQLLGSYLVFLSSTINGYEGTGRSLSLKLIDQLRQQANPMATKALSNKSESGYRMLREVNLNESIRYRAGDHVEEWLNKLLCLDAINVKPVMSGCPQPEDCELYKVNRDTLFSFHKASENFLHKLISLFVASHYKNSPNDLQMMSDAPAHQIFALLGPMPKQGLPEVLCVIQVCLEGAISKQSVLNSLSRGSSSSGDLIPWKMAQQFPDDAFPSLSGARVVRIATHPDYMRMGYGTRALQLLQSFFEGRCQDLDGDEREQTRVDELKGGRLKDAVEDTSNEEESGLLDERLKPRENLPPLLLRLSECRPERLDYLGVSYGLTQSLLRFWKRNGFTPVYLSQKANELTGEHNVIMLKRLESDEEDDNGWLQSFWNDFRRQVIHIYAFEFRKFTPTLALSLISNQNQKRSGKDLQALTLKLVEQNVTLSDLRRLDKYCNNLAEYLQVTYLLPNLAKLYFLTTLASTHRLSAVQEAILVAMGLQCKSAEQVGKELDLPVSQILGLFNRILRKLTGAIRDIYKQQAEKEIKEESLPSTRKASLPSGPLGVSMESELSEAASVVDLEHQKKKALASLQDSNLAQYAIKGTEEAWNEAVNKGTKKLKSLISVKSGQKRKDDEDSHNRSQGNENGKSNKKRKKGIKSTNTRRSM